MLHESASGSRFVNRKMDRARYLAQHHVPRKSNDTTHDRYNRSHARLSLRVSFDDMLQCYSVHTDPLNAAHKQMHTST